VPFVELVFGNQRVGPKDKAFGELTVLSMSTGLEIKIPFAVITGKLPGPVLYIGAGSHGDEISSILVATRLGRVMGPDDIDKGALLIVPMHNPLAIINKKRQGFIDLLDMNRVWPGDPDGNISEIIAYRIFEELVKKSNYLIDLHTASSDGENVPHGFCPSEEVSRGVYTVCVEMARYFGMRFIVVGKLNPERRKYYEYLAGELHIAASRCGIPGIVIELGEGGRVTNSLVEAGISGVQNTAKYLGILKGEPIAYPSPLIISQGMRSLRAPFGGIVTSQVFVGQEVNEGDVVAVLESPWTIREIKTPVSGYIFRLRHYAVVEPGERIAVIAPRLVTSSG